MRSATMNRKEAATTGGPPAVKSEEVSVKQEEEGTSVEVKEEEGESYKTNSSSLCNLLVYTSGESSSDDDDSDDSDSYDCESDKDVSEKARDKTAATTTKKTAKAANLVDTMGDLTLDDLPPVPDVASLKLDVSEEDCEQIGQISSIIDKLVMVESIPNKPAYDIDTLLFLNRGKQPLGYVFDVIGHVTCPMYAIRFNSKQEIAALNIGKGAPVYSAPKSEHTQYVFVQQLMKAKGTDASWKDDKEMPSELQDFSDDEAEIHSRTGTSDGRKRGSLERHKNFEKDMNVKNLIDTRLHKIRDNFEPITKKQTPNNNYANRGYQFQPNYRPSYGFGGVSGAYPPPFAMPPLVPMPPPPYNIPQFCPTMPPPPPVAAGFMPRLPPPPFAPPMQPFPAGQEVVGQLYQLPPPQVKPALYPPDMGLPRPPSQTFVPRMPFYDPRAPPVWHGYPPPQPQPNAQQPFHKTARSHYPKRQ